MAGNWKDSETKELLSIRSEEEIIRQLNGTVRDAVVYEKITQRARGFKRKDAENDAEATLSDTDTLKTEMCTEFVPLSPEESPPSPQSPPNKSAKKVSRVNKCVANIPDTKECTKFVHNSHEESPQSPPNKRAKKVSQEEQITKDMKECFAEIARTLEERERLRLLEQRQHEESLRKEAKESQNDLLKELLRHMPSPTLQQLKVSKYWHSGNQSRFITDTASNSNVQNTSEQDMIF
ncbi:hypothetical protein AMELA_G00249270 [Ameiurus melas]|uniref:Uncharacterized protein n=1 Tax=Ameiurus melas TaxID=219545 RepID=A0A7J5ZTX5_AMEME|nr:hypothetical protein AMELA_G00249270 [Ameiurus melas]